MVRDHFVEAIARRIGLHPLVLQGLVGGADAAVQNSLHWRLIVP
jgi:hypothetical protein